MADAKRPFPDRLDVDLESKDYICLSWWIDTMVNTNFERELEINGQIQA